jgi:hypothetical protein
MSGIERCKFYYVMLSERLARPRARFVVLTIYYLAILVGLLALYGRGDFATPPFIYQSF